MRNEGGREGGKGLANLLKYIVINNLKKQWCGKHFAAPILIDWSMTNYWAFVSGKGNRFNPRWRLNKQRHGHLWWSITTVRDQYLSFASFPTPLITHWSILFSWPVAGQTESNLIKTVTSHVSYFVHIFGPLYDLSLYWKGKKSFLNKTPLFT